jgi:glycosyltransferase involved in cell wall biosynthesis
MEQNITIGIKTFIRSSSLKYCLMRLRQRYKTITILVADDSTPEYKKINKTLCNRFKAEYLDLPFDTGLGYGRNQMIKKCKTKYYLTLDDDSLIDDRFDLNKLFLLIENTNLDIISCQRGVKKRQSKHYYHFFHSVDKISNERYGKYIIKYDQNMSNDRLIKNNINLRLYQCHLINENYIGKTNILQNNLYENDIKIGQHQLHFSKLFLNNIKIGYCPDIIIGEKVNYPEEYLKYRGRKGIWIKPDDIIMNKI